jgi:amino acid permease
MVAALLTIFLTQLIITFTASSHEPGVDKLRFTPYPLMHGFATSLNLHSSQGMILSLVAVYAACYGYAYSYGRLMCALSRSGFLPSIGSIVLGERQSPIAAMVGGNLLVFCTMCILFYYDLEERAVFASGTLASLVTYASIFVSFIVFRIRFTTLQKTLVNPFGIFSAIVGLLVFCIPAFYVFGYLDVRLPATLIFVFLIFVLSISYYFRAAATQRYSEDEQSVLLVLYVMTANRTRNKRNKQKAKASFAVYNKGTHATNPVVLRNSNTTNTTSNPSDSSPHIESQPSSIFNRVSSFWSRCFPAFTVTPFSKNTTASATSGVDNGRPAEASTAESFTPSGTDTQLKPLRGSIISQSNL